jgi:N-acetylneuraminic acid mutarotase
MVLCCLLMAQLSAICQAAGPWNTAAHMLAARRMHTATLLTTGPNAGMVLVIGGYNNTSGYLTSVELYDPATDSWSSATSLSTGRYGHTATLLADGTVLVVGGIGNDGSGFPTELFNAELYDPVNDEWSDAGFMVNAGGYSLPRNGHTATLLADNTVLVVGGSYGYYDNNSNYQYAYRNDAQVFNSVINADRNYWKPAAAMSASRTAHTAVRLSSGKVLVMGGTNGTNSLNSAELYDPGTGQWSTSPAIMSLARASHTSTLLANGTVLVAGGKSSTGSSLAGADLYDSTGTSVSAAGAMATSRYGHTATLLTNGNVLVLGGYNSTTGYLGSAELYDPTANSWSSAGSMAAARTFHAETLITGSGKVLATGGRNGGKAYLSTAELFFVPMTVAPSLLDFQSVATTTTGTSPVTVTNSGPVSLAIGSASFSGSDAALFGIGAGGTCGASLGASSSCTINISFSPTTLGSKSALLSIASDNPLLLTVPLAGIGAANTNTLTFIMAGTGSGTVSGSTNPVTSPLNYTTNTAQSFNLGTVVTLSATPDTGSSFTGWSGDCSGAGTCLVTMNAPKSVTAAFKTPLAISTANIPSGTTGDPYSQAITASGGTPPYSWGILSGILPTGLTFNTSTGLISGTPGKAGVYSLALWVADSEATNAGKSLAIAMRDVGCVNQPTMITPLFYPDIISAYQQAANGNTVALQALDFNSDLLFDRDVSITLRGGYDCGYTVNGTATGFLGKLRVTNGTARIDNVRFR